MFISSSTTRACVRGAWDMAEVLVGRYFTFRQRQASRFPAFSLYAMQANQLLAIASCHCTNCVHPKLPLKIRDVRHSL